MRRINYFEFKKTRTAFHQSVKKNHVTGFVDAYSLDLRGCQQKLWENKNGGKKGRKKYCKKKIKWLK